MTTNEPSDQAAVVNDLWRWYDEHAAQARQHENLRATVTSILASIAAAVVAFAGVGGLTTADVPAGVVVLILSALGFALSLKHYERNRMHTTVMQEIRKEIDRLRITPAAAKSTRDIRRAAVAKHNDEFSAWKKKKKNEEAQPGESPWVRMRLHLLWLALPVGIGIVGLLVLVLAIVGVSAS